MLKSIRLLCRAAFAFCLLWSGSMAAVIAADNASSAASPTSDPSTWKPEIRAQYDAIRALPGLPKEPVIAAVRKLAAQGPDARAALAALAAEAALPEPQRAMAGIMSTYFIRFDVSALRATVETSTNPFARRQAIDFLAEIGGPQIQEFLTGVSRQEASLAAHTNNALARMPAAETISADDRRLLTIILLEPTEAKAKATFALAERHKGKTDLDAWLESLLISPVSDSDTQIHAATTLVKIHRESVPELTAMTARNKHRFVRYNAVVELSGKGPAGEAVLRELLASPDEPLKKQIEAQLAKM